MWNLEKNGTGEPICKTEIDRPREQTYGHQGEKWWMGWSGRLWLTQTQYWCYVYNK